MFLCIFSEAFLTRNKMRNFKELRTYDSFMQLPTLDLPSWSVKNIQP